MILLLIIFRHVFTCHSASYSFHIKRISGRANIIRRILQKYISGSIALLWDLSALQSANTESIVMKREHYSLLFHVYTCKGRG